MPFVENFEEFRQRMGCPFITTGRRYLFENGGVSDGSIHTDPPEDEFVLLRLRRDYIQHQLTTEVREWKAYKNQQLDQAQLHLRYVNLPGADSHAPDVLRQGQERITAMRERIAEIDSRLQQTPGQNNQRHSEETADELHMEATRLASDIASLEI